MPTHFIPRGYSGPFTRVGYAQFSWLEPRAKSTRVGAGAERAAIRLKAKREANKAIPSGDRMTRQRRRAAARAST